jgi:hypothetical protein
MQFRCQWQPTHFGWQLIALWLFRVLAVPVSDMCHMEHHVHTQRSCNHHSYPSFSTQYFFGYSVSGLHMFRINSTKIELQYIRLRLFAGNSHNNTPENMNPPLFGDKNIRAQIQYVCLGQFAGNTCNNVQENTNLPLFVIKSLSGYLSHFQIFSAHGQEKFDPMKTIKYVTGLFIIMNLLVSQRRLLQPSKYHSCKEDLY